MTPVLFTMCLYVRSRNDYHAPTLATGPGGSLCSLDVLFLVIHLLSKFFAGQYRARANPSAGSIPYLQSFICNLGNVCNNLSSYQDIPSYEGSMLENNFNFEAQFDFLLAHLLLFESWVIFCYTKAQFNMSSKLAGIQRGP